MDRHLNSHQNPQGDDQQMVTKPKIKSSPWYKRGWGIALLSFIGFIFLLFIFLGVVGYQTYQKLIPVKENFQTLLYQSGNNLDLSKKELAKAKSNLQEAYQTYRLTLPIQYVPLLGGYLRDGDHIFLSIKHLLDTLDLVVDSLQPYADILGLEGGQTREFKSAEERIIFLSDTVKKLAPQMDEISRSLGLIDAEIQQINEKRYPNHLGDLALRSRIIDIKSSSKSLASSLSQFQPFVELLPDLLGNPEERKYLILFQNDAELRPTGGFMTAYATMSILRGKITAGVSQDIYTLDNAFTQKVPAPDPIKKYLPLVYNWNLRDMNLSPDFKVSMDTFSHYYQQVPGSPQVDAIIAIDTQIPVRLLKILGPIGIPGYGGKFSAEPDPRCDGGCPQVIYELENIITRPTYEIREGRKSILGPLMNSMLANMMGSPKAKWAQFLDVFINGIKEKHLMMYFFDADKQKAVEALGAAGRIVSYQGDYLHINDTNFAGAKSNLFVEQEVDHKLEIQTDGSVKKQLTLTYKNPAKPSNCNLEAGQLCLNGLLRDWIRIYVPKGSKLTAARGFEVTPVTSTDLGKTVFEGFFTLAPESVKKLEIEYTTPAGTVPAGEDYKLLIQQQAGLKPIQHSFALNHKLAKELVINSDTEIVLPR